LPMILPQLDQAAMFKTINFSANINCTTNKAILQDIALPALYCPSDPTPTLLTDRGFTAACATPLPVTGNVAGSNAYTARVTHYLGSFGDGCIVGENQGWTNGGDASFTNFGCGGCSAPGGTHCSNNAANITALCTRPSNGFGGGANHRGMFNYLGNTPPVKDSDVKDGTSSTILMGHTAGIAMGWDNVWASTVGSVNGTILPINFNILPSMQQGRFYCPPPCNLSGRPWRGRGFQSHHGTTSGFTMVDGSVRFMSQNINMRIYNGLGSRHGREVVTVD
jgi:hypothetical protein